MDQSTIKVIIADEHYLFREGIKALLSSVSEVRVIEEATTAADAVRLAETHGADLLMLDAALSDPEFDLVKKMRETRPNTRVLLVSNSDVSAGVDLAAQAGAAGWLGRNWPAPEILKAIKQSVPLAANGASEGAKGSGASGSVTEAGEIALTRREHEILQLLMLRRSSREIAATLALSVKTVESHKFNLMRKLDVHSRSELIKLAIRRQLVSQAASVETVESQPA
ncbi:MAG: response regulator transcription factor [Bryobacteraceae bacterium]